MKRFKYLTLAALVAFAACDEGDDGTPASGSITGTVTIEGTGASGVTVALSSGASTTTDGSGAYTFSNVEAGSYTVSISGYPADATFGSTSQAAAITAAGQVVTVNFSGTFVRTSAILGNVSAGGSGLAGVNVSIGSQSKTTDANGQYSFSGLRAGSYNVTISGFDATKYVFAQTSQSVTLAAGESKVVSFSGQFTTTAKIVGKMFVDENPKNDVFDSSESALAAANVTISLQLGLGAPVTTETAADGSYEFANLAPGTYQVTIASTDTDIPSNYKYGGASASTVTTINAGTTTTVNFPFDIFKQTMRVGAFLGRDAGTAMVAPVQGVIVDLYPTEADLNALTNRLGRDTTEADGYTSFLFERTKDTAPGGGTDNIVYARFIQAPSALYTLNGETQVEIAYPSSNAVATGPDVFDFLYTRVVLGFAGQEIDGDSLPGWITHTRVSDTTSTTGQVVKALNAAGTGYITVDWTGGVGSIDSLYTRLTPAQTLNNGHVWKQTPTGDRGTAVGSFVRFVWDGTILPTDTVMLGHADVKYLDANLAVRLHREADDTLGLTTLDDFFGNGQVSAKIVNSKGNVPAPAWDLTPFPGSPGELTFVNVPVDSAWTVVAVRTSNNLVMIQDTTLAFTLDGSDQTAEFFNGMSTFATKTWRNRIEGDVFAKDGVTGADSIAVTIAPTAMNIGGTWTRTIYTNAAGHYATPDSLLDGPYTVTVAEKSGRTKWAFFDTLKVASAPTSSGDANNTDASTGVRDVQGNLDVVVANFQATRMDTKVVGRVINDRDDDNNTIDPNEALAGAQIELVQSKAVLATATTDANGGYSFTGLREGTYMVRWVDDTPDATVTVLKALSTDSAFVTTTAAAATAGGSIAALPRWNYATSAGDGDDDVADFMFLYKNTVAKAIVQTGAGTKIAGMTVSLRRCNTSAGATSPPAAGTCTTYLGTTVTAVSDASGVATFSNLIEGVYQVSPQPGTVGTYTTSVPVNALYLTVGSADVESRTFVIS